MDRLVAPDRSGAAFRPSPPGAAGATHRWSRVLQLQRTAGNRAVGDLVAQRQGGKRLPVPDPLDFGGVGGRPFEGAVSSDPYDRQPDALRTVIDETGRTMALPRSVYPTPNAEQHKGALWWSGLDAKQRGTVVSIYNRMQTLGLWRYVQRIQRVTHAECQVLKRFQVSGDTPSVVFGGDVSGLAGALTGHGRMCYDAGIGGSLHAGQMSNREISEGDSLHVSVGRSAELGKGEGDFDVHIDRYASPKGKRGLACEYDVGRTLLHQGREVVPSLVRKKLRVPGVEVFPEETDRPGVRPEMFERREDEEKPPVTVGVTWRFGR